MAWNAKTIPSGHVPVVWDAEPVSEGYATVDATNTASPMANAETALSDGSTTVAWDAKTALDATARWARKILIRSRT